MLKAEITGNITLILILIEVTVLKLNKTLLNISSENRKEILASVTE